MVSWHGLGIDPYYCTSQSHRQSFICKIRVINESIVTNTRQQLEGMKVIRAFDQSERELDNFTAVNKG